MADNPKFLTKTGTATAIASAVSDHNAATDAHSTQFAGKVDTLKVGDSVSVSTVENGAMDVSALFSSENTSLTSTIKDCGGVQHDDDGYFIETED